MKMNYKLMMGFLVLATSAMAMGCKPKTTAQKVEDKIEDAGHEIGQGMERTGENINDATNKK